MVESSSKKLEFKVMSAKTGCLVTKTLHMETEVANFIEARFPSSDSETEYDDLAAQMASLKLNNKPRALFLDISDTALRAFIDICRFLNNADEYSDRSDTYDEFADTFVESV